MSIWCYFRLAGSYALVKVAYDYIDHVIWVRWLMMIFLASWAREAYEDIDHTHCAIWAYNDILDQPDYIHWLRWSYADIDNGICGHFRGDWNIVLYKLTHFRECGFRRHMIITKILERSSSEKFIFTLVRPWSIRYTYNWYFSCKWSSKIKEYLYFDFWSCLKIQNIL